MKSTRIVFAGILILIVSQVRLSAGLGGWFGGYSASSSSSSSITSSSSIISSHSGKPGSSKVSYSYSGVDANGKPYGGHGEITDEQGNHHSYSDGQGENNSYGGVDDDGVSNKAKKSKWKGGRRRGKGSTGGTWSSASNSQSGEPGSSQVSYSYGGVDANGKPYGGYSGNAGYEVATTDDQGNHHSYSGGLGEDKPNDYIH